MLRTTPVDYGYQSLFKNIQKSAIAQSECLRQAPTQNKKYLLRLLYGKRKGISIITLLYTNK